MRLILLATLVGAGFGLGAGLLCAPVSGRRARLLVTNTAQKAKQNALEFMNERKEHFEMARQKFDFAPRHIDDSLDDATMEALAGR